MIKKEVELYTNTLYKGMILEGDAYDENKNKVLDKNTPLTDEDIRYLKDDGIKLIRYTREIPNIVKDDDNAPVSEEHFDKAKNILSDIHDSIRDNASVSIANHLNELIGDFITDIEENYSTKIGLFELSNLDEYTYTHSINTAILAIMFGISLKKDKREITEIGKSGLLMDIGMVLVPEEIRHKTEDLSDEEWKIIKQHPVYSYNFLKNSPGIGKNILNAVLLHHEFYKGGGYPTGVDHTKISETAQIISMADVFDAATSEKKYKQPDELSELYNYYLQSAGVKFPPKLSRKFLIYAAKKLSEEPIFPDDVYVLLNTGEIGAVTGRPRGRYSIRPVINIIVNLKKKDDPVLKFEMPVDLEQDYSRYIVERILDESFVEKLDYIRKKTKMAQGGVILF